MDKTYSPETLDTQAMGTFTTNQKLNKVLPSPNNGDITTDDKTAEVEPTGEAKLPEPPAGLTKDKLTEIACIEQAGFHLYTARKPCR